MDALTGEAAVLYLGVMLDASGSGRPIDSRLVARDAYLAQGNDRGATGRLRLARVMHRVHASVNRLARPPAAAAVPRPTVRSRAVQARRSLRTAAGGIPARPPRPRHA